MRIILIVIFSSAVISSCYYDNEEELYPKAPLPDSLKVTYGSHIKDIMTTYCTSSGCHSVTGGASALTTYGSVKKMADNGKLEDRVLLQQNMPPSAPLPKHEQDLLKRWLETGRKEK